MTNGEFIIAVAVVGVTAALTGPFGALIGTLVVLALDCVVQARRRNQRRGR